MNVIPAPGNVDVTGGRKRLEPGCAQTEGLRPTLADNMGGALLIGTPRGHDHFCELYESAQRQQHGKTFQFTTEEGGNVRTEEI